LFSLLANAEAAIRTFPDLYAPTWPGGRLRFASLFAFRC